MKDIREFGAIGDGRVDDTSAIQAALQGGGLIVVPAGRYLTGTLYLESDTELRLAPGAELLASTDPAAYNPAQFSPENTLPSVTERVSARHLLITSADDVWYATGLGSTNGTAIMRPGSSEPVVVEPPRSERPDGTVRPTRIKQGDILCLGSTTRFLVVRLAD